MTKFVSKREICERAIRDRVPLARKLLWIATADIKDMYVDSVGRDMVPFLKVLATLIGKGDEIRLIHAKEPGPNFRYDFDRYTLEDQFDAVWSGNFSRDCGRKDFCGDPIL